MFINNENGALVRPDVSKDAGIEKSLQTKINWVGMDEIRMPIHFSSEKQGLLNSIASIRAVVSLDNKAAKGIHMSRIFLRVEELSSLGVNKKSVEDALKNILDSHSDLSERAMVEMKFPIMLKRPALLSDNVGWREYPLYMRVTNEGGKLSYSYGIRVTYSSTCPCSAALARQIIQNNFKNKFSSDSLDFDAVMEWLGKEEAVSATPHSQRSFADVWFESNRFLEIDEVISLIDGLESVVKTPVQSAVKREDEQEFARLNGTFPVFVEDSIRKIHGFVDGVGDLTSYKIKVSHFESLHAHDAVAEVSKGDARFPDGF